MTTRTKLTVGGLLIAAALVVLIYFQPQKLFIDQEVDEAAPVAAIEAEAETAGDTESPASGSTSFRPLDHDAAGQVSVVTTESGEVVRFEDFSVENGPDLFVYLSSADPGSTDDSVFDDDFVNLGKLKGNQGNQNYTVPEGVDLDDYQSVVVWCERFSTGFAVAPLTSS